MNKEEFYFPSMDGIHQIHAIRYCPDKVKAVLQIVHGMTEYGQRYEELARYLNERHIAVYVHDHLGHGLSVNQEEDYGYFGEEGNRYLMGDIRQLCMKAQEDYPDIPFFIMGHSMGSFLTRQYIQNYHDLDGAIVMGTGMQSDATLKFGIALTGLLSKWKGDHYRSSFIKKMAMGSYNKRTPKRTENDWLSSDDHEVDIYNADRKCTFTFTLNGYREMFKSILDEQDADHMAMMDLDLPLFFISGTDDPVGHYGKDVLLAVQYYEDCGCEDITLDLRDGDRHEVLHEKDKKEVFASIAQWIEDVLEGE